MKQKTFKHVKCGGNMKQIGELLLCNKCGDIRHLKTDRTLKMRFFDDMELGNLIPALNELKDLSDVELEKELRKREFDVTVL